MWSKWFEEVPFNILSHPSNQRFISLQLEEAERSSSCQSDQNGASLHLSAAADGPDVHSCQRWVTVISTCRETDPCRWRRYLTVLGLLHLVWSFCILTVTLQETRWHDLFWRDDRFLLFPLMTFRRLAVKLTKMSRNNNLSLFCLGWSKFKSLIAFHAFFLQNFASRSIK